MTTELPPIELPEVRRLNLQPGDALAIIAPEWASNPRVMQEFGEFVKAHFEDSGIRVIVLAHGTDLATVRPDDKALRAAVKDEIRREARAAALTSRTRI